MDPRNDPPPPVADFAAATRLTPIERVADGGGRWAVDLDPGWQGAYGFFGGYIAALLTRGIVSVGTAAHHPLTVTIDYLRPPSVGRAEVVTRVERAGRRLVTVGAWLCQAGREMAVARGVLCIPEEGPEKVDAPFPDVPPPAACPTWRPPQWSDLPILDRYEVRAAWNGHPGAGLDVADTAGWARTAEPTALEAPLVAFLADVFLAPVMVQEARNLHTPTVELQLSFRVPLPTVDRPHGWYLSHLRSEFANAGYVEQSGDVWTEEGQLVARMRHLIIASYAPGDPSPG